MKRMFQNSNNIVVFIFSSLHNSDYVIGFTFLRVEIVHMTVTCRIALPSKVLANVIIYRKKNHISQIERINTTIHILVQIH